MKLSDLVSAEAEQNPEETSTVSRTLETEYSFIAKVNVNELVAKLREDPEVTSTVFIEGILTYDKTLGKIRLRHFPNEKKQSTTKMDLKLRIDEMRSIEEVVEIPESFLKPLIPICKSVTARVRFFIPAKNPRSGEIIKYPDGKLLVWEVDFYLNTLTPTEEFSEATVSEWVKIELEVRDASLEIGSVERAIPFECLQILDSRTKEESERVLIDTLYNSVYNLSGKPMEPEQHKLEDHGNDENDRFDDSQFRVEGDGNTGEDEGNDDTSFKFEDQTPPATDGDDQTTPPENTEQTPPDNTEQQPEQTPPADNTAGDDDSSTFDFS